MHTLFILREELICLLIILYLLANNIVCGAKQLRNTFTYLSIFATGHVLFDIVTVYTVNHMDIVPSGVNHACHLLFYLFGSLFAIEFFKYVFFMIYPAAEKPSQNKVLRYIVFSFMYLAVFYFIPIEYIKGDNTCYSNGPAAVVAFSIPLFFFICTTALIIAKRKTLNRVVIFALLPMLMVLFVAEIVEIIWIEILITGGAMTLVTIGVYFSLENPRLFHALKQAKASDRAKSFFLASMSHEIRTPLNAIIGFSELLNNDELDKTTRKEYQDGISNAGKALLAMINDVLDLSKLESDQMLFTPVETDVNELIMEIEMIFRQQMAAKGLKTVYDTNIKFLISLDKLRLRQILFNLIGNAVKFTRHGSITVTARFVEDTPYNGTLIFSVSDTGVGISDDDKEAIFQPFVQSKAMRGTHAANRGTGLGLTIVKRIITKMGGEITLKSEPGKGSEFTVTMPNLKYAQQIGYNNTRSDECKVIDTALNAHILLVDDIELNLKVTEAMCRQLGITTVCSTHSGEDALAMFSKNDFNLVFTDLWMPDMNGIELAREIRKINSGKKTFIIALTADIEASINYPHDVFDEVMLKPITMKSLRSIISKYSLTEREALS